MRQDIFDKIMMTKKLLPLIFILLVLSGCRTYYQKNIKFQNYFASGQMQEASDLLDKDQKAKKRRNKVLYLLNQGVVKHLLGDNVASNIFFEDAYNISEDYSKKFLDETLAMFSNPNLTEYRLENFELLHIHYFKAMNFLYLNDYDAALVECRRMYNKLNVLSDKYTSDNRYKKDAFVNNLMGIIYDATGDYNNAFIAYRNAYEIYKEDYTNLYGIGVPWQLKYDLIRAAYRTGLKADASRYEKEFDIKYNPEQYKNHEELVFFWLNGLGPVKDEWSINFTIVKGQGGYVHFVNEELGLSFPFLLKDDDKSSGGLGDLKIIRVAFPKYVERRPIYSSAQIRINNKVIKLEPAQSINAIAHKSLEDRMHRELGKGLLRLALKQVAEESLRKKDETSGALLGILNAATEKADTRNWQTLPHSIHYTRVFLPEGENTFMLEVKNESNNVIKSHNLIRKITKQKTSFMYFFNLDSRLK